MSHSKSATPFRRDIEGLRGIAVSLVVAFHAGLYGVRGGFIGVDVFFAMSGYLITGLLVEEIERNGHIAFLGFYARRVRRLLPASALMSAVTLSVCALMLGPDELASAARAARASAVYLSNVYFSINAADYFAADVKRNPFLHTWSLSVEEQFYFVWPLLLAIGMRLFRSRRGLRGLLVVMTVVSFAVCLRATSHSSPLAFYQLPARAWEFGIGGVAALTPVHLWRLSGRTVQWTRNAGLALVLLSGALITESGQFPGWIAAVPVCGTVIVLLAGAASPDQSVGGLLNHPVLQVTGRLSYSWYLWHWPFLVLSEALFPGLSVVLKIAVALSSLGVAAMAHEWIENPVRFNLYLNQVPARSLGLGAVLTTLALVTSWRSLSFADELSERPEQAQVSNEVRSDLASLSRANCMSLGSSSEVKQCTVGPPTASRRIVLFGDSHALQWFNPLLRIAESDSLRVTTILKSSCPAAIIDVPNKAADFVRSCNEWRRQALHTIDSIRPTLLIAAGASVYLTISGKPAANSGLSVAQWSQGVRRLFQQLDSAHVRTIWLRDNPLPPVNAPTCVARALRHGWYPRGSCRFDRSKGQVQEVFDEERRSATGLHFVSFVDMTDQICPDASCPMATQGQLVYHDDHHLSGGFTSRLAAVLRQRLFASVPMR